MYICRNPEDFGGVSSSIGLDENEFTDDGSLSRVLNQALLLLEVVISIGLLLLLPTLANA